MRGIVVSVDYDDYLALTLPWNARHMDEVLVITSFEDQATPRIVDSVPNARLLRTDGFYRHGAKFNKGQAIEDGFGVLGHKGWILVHDADVLLPRDLQLPPLEIGKLYSTHRYILEELDNCIEVMLGDWSGLPRRIETQFPGYFQLFHAEDPVLAPKPWYGIDYRHAGGCDTVFQDKWAAKNRVRLPSPVLHLGPHGTNWYGRISDRIDGAPVANVEERKQDLEAMYAQRKQHKRRGGHPSERLP